MITLENNVAFVLDPSPTIAQTVLSFDSRPPSSFDFQAVGRRTELAKCHPFPFVDVHLCVIDTVDA